jgi:hypothetical protein
MSAALAVSQALQLPLTYVIRLGQSRLHVKHIPLDILCFLNTE